MKNKKPFIYLGLAILAAIVIFTIENPSTERVNDASSLSFVPNFDTSKVSRMEIGQLMDGAEIERTEDGWKVSTFVTPIKKQLIEQSAASEEEKEWKKADTRRVENAINSLFNLEKGVVVSENPEKFDLYQAGKLGLSLKIYDSNSNELASLIVGKTGGDFTSTYVRKDGENKLYLAKGLLMGVFSPRASDWEEKEEEKHAPLE